MQDLLRTYVANGLQDFKGLRITGSIPLKEDLLNQLLAGLVTGELAGANSAGSDAVDVTHLRSLVKRAVVKADAGVLTVTFEIAVE